MYVIHVGMIILLVLGCFGRWVNWLGYKKGVPGLIGYPLVVRIWVGGFICLWGMISRRISGMRLGRWLSGQLGKLLPPVGFPFRIPVASSGHLG